MNVRPLSPSATAVSTKFSRGFSIVEILIVVAVIAIITAIAIPAIGNINSNAAITTAQSNAQNIASVFSAGISAGASSFLTCGSVGEAQDAVGVGAYGTGTTSSTLFQLPGVTQHTDDAKPADQRSGDYLVWQNGVLVYDKSGGHAN